MGFKPLTEACDTSKLKEEFKNSYKIGLINLGEEHFFFKSGFRRFYIPYSGIQRCFRRVMLLPYGRKKDGRNIEMEYAVLMHEGKELAQIQLPGTKAAQELLEKVHEKAPDAKLECPKKRGKDKIRN